MDEISKLIELIKELPDVALYILAGFLIYKMFILGSVTTAIYKAITLAITKWHDYAKAKEERPFKKDLTLEINGLLIRSTEPMFMEQIKRLVGLTTQIGSDYIHKSDIIWLEEAITEKMEREKAEGKKFYRTSSF